MSASALSSDYKSYPDTVAGVDPRAVIPSVFLDSRALFCFFVLDVYDLAGYRVHVDLSNVLGVGGVNLKGPDKLPMFAFQLAFLHGPVRDFGQSGGLCIGPADFGPRLKCGFVFGFATGDEPGYREQTYNDMVFHCYPFLRFLLRQDFNSRH